MKLRSNAFIARAMAGLFAAIALSLASAHADDVTVLTLASKDGKDGKDSKDAKASPPPAPRLKIYGWVEGGITTNPASPTDHSNFGHLFTDRPNEPMANQIVLTAERVLVPEPGKWDWGFKFQFLYGTDGRYLHSTGFMDLTTKQMMQPDIVEAYLNLHAPLITEGGIDLKLGKFVTLEGAETIDPRTNVFYSHSYIFNFGIPLNHTGGLAVLHATKWLDIYGGLTTGVNTSSPVNDCVGFHGGLGLNLLSGSLTVLATTAIGPNTPNDNHDYRYLSDITTTWTINSKLTAITDLNYAYDAGADARAFGGAQYLTYAVTDWLSAGIRGEVWRDEEGFFAAQFASQNDFLHTERGDSFTPDVRTVSGGKTTYGEVTFGVTLKAPANLLPKHIAGLSIRPEIRYDSSLNDSHPFDNSSKRDQLTAGLDVILQF